MDEYEKLFWGILIIIACVMIGCYYYLSKEKQKRQLPAKERDPQPLIDNRLAMNDMNNIIEKCWNRYVELNLINHNYNLCKSIICNEGILYYWQRLQGFLSSSLDEEQLASRITGLIFNNLYNVATAKLSLKDGVFVLPDTPKPTMDKNTYLYNIGVDVEHLKTDERIKNMLQNELFRIEKEMNELKGNTNRNLYNGLLHDLLPIINIYCTNENMENQAASEVICSAKKFSTLIEKVVERYGIHCIFYCDATVKQQNEYFVLSSSASAREMPAIVRQDELIYCKGTHC